MKYPIGIQTFERIRKDGFVYVDKTDLIYKLVTEGRIYFLDFPNNEVKRGFVTMLAANYLKPRQSATSWIVGVVNAKGYACEYESDKRKLYKIGINFSSETGTISDWLVE